MALYASTVYAPTAYGSAYQSGWNAATTYPAAAGTMVPYNPAPYLGTVELYNAMGTSQYVGSRRPWSNHRLRSTIEFNDWDTTNPYWMFSTFAPLPLYDDQGRYHATAAHLFQSRKFLDPRMADQVSACPTARAAKDLADSWRPYIRPDWRRVNAQLMEWVLREKLRQHPQFQELLLNTGRAYLLNTSRDDSFWGIGSGRGRNELGRALMRLRKEL
ncbi:DUF1768-domain-containing protein [Calocera viscosa TUFC12733]|uniref:DUF1768-domain-containing protein n=1 Tax=Calocera viscosa (strain TUFC12733) TaxID=1330018 RepID=A0A167J212_CALVF|nr:DUF1768-domain-containing protein [Calocera viscosa TUFC12733]